MITLLIYDGSFEGLLTAVFEVYERKLVNVKIIRNALYQPILSGESLTIISDSAKAERVWAGLNKKLSFAKCLHVFQTFLSEQENREEVILRFIQHIFSNAENVEKDFSHHAVLAIEQIAHKVHREKHRMEAFVRFQHTKDDVYFATIEPDYNVLPLITSHFKDRYADQHWMIYDVKRNYGIHYDKNSGSVNEVQLQLNPEAEFLSSSMCMDDELRYQTLWQSYFQHINIKARKNTKLHIRHVPIRYWKYLTEKRPQ